MKTRLQATRTLLLAMTMAAGCPIAGCGQPAPPPRHPLQGKATYDGRPIPKAIITFTPDESQGNKGLQGVADVRNGEYRTRDGSGVSGGPYFIHIDDHDTDKLNREPAGGSKSQFGTYVTSADIPADATTFDVSVPVRPTDTKRVFPKEPEVAPTPRPVEPSKPAEPSNPPEPPSTPPPVLPQPPVATPHYNYAAIAVLAWTCRVLALVGLLAELAGVISLVLFERGATGWWWKTALLFAGAIGILALLITAELLPQINHAAG